ncbi:MAG: wax ester/triacylglycerol synthase family O-acyltransferase [Pseudomonadota bacterium]
MQQVQGLDAAFVAMETNKAPVHIGSLYIYDPSTAPGQFVRFKDIIKFFSDRMQYSKTLRQKLVKVPFGIDYPYWVRDANFDLEYHVRHVALPQPGDWRQLCILAARIFARPLDLSRPPWEFTIIEGLDNIKGVPKGSYAMVTKVHHVAVDGMSGMEMLKATHAMSADEAPPDTIDDWRPEPNPSQLGLFTRGIMNSYLLPFKQARAMVNSAPGTARVVKGLVKKEYDLDAVLNTPKTRFGGVISPHRVFGARTLKMADIQEMRALADGAKMNDIMLSITGGAMRNYLEHHGELPDTSVTAMAPISVRDQSEKTAMGNQVSAMYVPLGSHIADAQARIAYVRGETRKAKAMTEDMGARQTAEVAKLMPNAAMTLGADIYQRFKLANRLKTMVNTVVTNVPGPPVPLYNAGAKLLGFHGMLCLVDGVRLGHVVQTYLDDVSLSFMACREAMPDPEVYNQCITRSYEEHKEALKNFKKRAEVKKTEIKKPPAKRKTTKPTTSKANGRSKQA